MASTIAQQALELPPAERVELIQALWDSLPQDTPEVRLTAPQLEELSRRERLLEEHGPSGDLWEVAEKRLKSRLHA